MIKNILVLAFNDLYVALRNKTIFLILFIPFFVFVSLKLIDQGDANAPRMQIGLLSGEAYAPEVTRSLKAAEAGLGVVWAGNLEEGTRLVKERKVAGLLSNDKSGRGGLALLVLKKDSLRTVAVVQVFSALQKTAEGSRPGWITEIRSLQGGGVQRETLPTWVLMLILLVGFIIMPSQVAEEKEKKLLLGLLQTPIHEVQWLIAKLLMGMALILVSVVFLHLLGQFGPVNIFAYSALILAGGYCFSAFGILLGFLCRSQASARTLGVIFYLPHLLPSALSDVSRKMTAVAPFLPSYQLYRPLQALLFEDGAAANMSFELAYLFLAGTLMIWLSYFLMKRRWLM